MNHRYTEKTRTSFSKLQINIIFTFIVLITDPYTTTKWQTKPRKARNLKPNHKNIIHFLLEQLVHDNTWQNSDDISFLANGGVDSK